MNEEKIIDINIGLTDEEVEQRKSFLGYCFIFSCVL